MKKHIVIEAQNDTTGKPAYWISKLNLDDALARRIEFNSLDEALKDASTFSIGSEKVRLTIVLNSSMRLETVPSS